jgi:transcriptional regulator with XRE-family HTH domain
MVTKDRFELKDINTIGSRIELIRRNNNVSREELCDYLDVSKKVLYNIENDISMPSVEVLVKLHNKFKVSIDYILLGKR